MGTERLFEQALGITNPRAVKEIRFDAAVRQLAIAVEFAAGSGCAPPAHPGTHPVHDTQTKRLRHLNFFRYDSFLSVRVPRVRIPDGKAAPAEPARFGPLAGFTAAVRGTGAGARHAVGRRGPPGGRILAHRVNAVCTRYVELALRKLDLSEVRALANEETSYRRGHDYLTAAFDAMRRLEHRTDPSLKGLRWTLLRDQHKLSADSHAELDSLIAQVASKHTARAWG